MKQFIMLLIGAVMTVSSINAQEIKKFEAAPNQTVEITGNLTEGAIMSDISWAWNSSVACFPATRKTKFTGSHVLYTTSIPKYSEMEVRVIPDDENANFSIYAYEVGKVGADNTVPNLSSCIRCEADFKWEYKRKGKTQDHTRVVKDLIAINRPYEVVIGVVGAEGLTEGGYKLQITTVTK